MKYKKRRAMIATFLIGGTFAVIGAHLVEEKMRTTQPTGVEVAKLPNTYPAKGNLAARAFHKALETGKITPCPVCGLRKCRGHRGMKLGRH